MILSIGPYFNHSGQTGLLGPVQGTSIDPVGPSAGPSGRFNDLVDGAKLMERGYTFVMVDLRGFGGSSGCLDWGGPGEQADVKAAVEWAAAQPWSTGRVGMYGKSYDGVTGLVGAISAPKGLAAVVSQEPVYDMYRYLFANGVRFVNSLGTPALYDAIALTPGPLLDSPLYNVGGLTDPVCLATNYVSQQDPNHFSPYWRARDLIAKAKASDSKVPLFLTQGFLENNTKPDGTWDLYNALDGPKRAWFGMWDHVRGNDVDADGRLLMGRAGWFDEVMRFYDHYVREVPLADAPTDRDPANVVQTSDGSWRAEAAWPPADSETYSTALRAGSYPDDGQTSGTGEGAASSGTWTISPPLAHDAHFAGVPKAQLDLVTSQANTNVVVDVYDIAPDRKATLIARNTALVPASGKLPLELYGNDWLFPAGHRVGVLVTGANAEWWLHLPTFTTVELKGGTIDLPFLTFQRTAKLDGTPAVRLESYREEAPFVLPEETIKGGESAGFKLPAALKPAPAGGPGSSQGAGGSQGQPGSAGTSKPRLLARIARRGRRITIYGNAPSRARVRITLRRGKRIAVRRRTTARVGAFRITIRVRRGGSYRATVTATRGKLRLSARTRALRVR